MPRPRHLAGAICAVLLFSATAAATDFSQVVVFGDSLSDNGNVSSLGGGPRMRFTTNPGLVAMEDVAAHYSFTLQPSTSGGTDYAWGGAQAAIDRGPLVSAQTQVNNYLAANGGKADGHALYSMWIGANDLLNINIFKPLNQQMIDAANVEVASLKQLQAAGARTVVVFNLPDVRNTPAVRGTGLAVIAGQLGSLYNTTLNDGVAGLDRGIVPVNVYALLNEAIADPARYGFSNVTAPACGAGASSVQCGPQGSGAPYTYPAGADQSYLFADGVHPTTAAHAMLAEVVLSELAAPQQVSLLGETALTDATTQTRTIRQQMEADDLGGPGGLFLNVDYGDQRFERSDSSPRTRSDNLNLTLGGDFRASEQLSAGVALGIGQNRAKPAGGSSYNVDDFSALGYLTYHAGGGYLGGYASYGHSDFNDVERRFQVGASPRTEVGDTNGNHRGVGLTGGWWFGADTLKTGPFANVEWQRITVDGYREEGEDSTAMWFGGQERKALLSALGWRLRGDLQSGDTTWSPYLELAWNHDSKADPREVTAGLNTLNGRFAMVGFTPDKSWASAEVGLDARFSNRVSAWLDYHGRFSDNSQRDNGINLGMKIAF